MAHPLPIEIFSDEVKKALTLCTINKEVVNIFALSCGFTQVMMNGHECIHEFDSIHELVKFFMIHTHGKFDETHFNIPDLMKGCFQVSCINGYSFKEMKGKKMKKNYIKKN